MKRSFIFVVLSLFSLGLTLGLTACGKHEHSCSNWSVVTEATCTAEGLRAGVCDDCGEEMTEVIAELPHQYGEWENTVAPTCTALGSHEHFCTVCGFGEVEEIDKIPHTPKVIYGTEPTCTEVGFSNGSECSVCGEVLEAQREIPAKGHSFEDWNVTKPADCGVPGEQERRCLVCSHLETEEIPQLEHIWLNWEPAEVKGTHIRKCAHNPQEHILEEKCEYAPSETIKVTCTEEGYTLEVCPYCNDSIKTHIQQPAGHIYGNYISIITDEDEEGHIHKHYRQCVNCPVQEEPEECQPTLENRGPVAATCTDAPYNKWVCTKCEVVHEEVTGEATGHNLVYRQNWNPISPTHYQECTNANCNFRTEADRCSITVKVNPATCTTSKSTDYFCPVCSGNRNIPESGSNPLGHQYVWEFTGSKDNPTHRGVCQRENCHDTIEGVCEIDSIETAPTCTADGEITKTCRICQNVFTENGLTSTGHQWEWTNKSQTQHTKRCTKCNTIQTDNHRFNLVENTPASCTEYEKNRFKCEDCEFEKVEQGSSELGHIWQIDGIYSDRHHRTCLQCEAVDEGPHDYQNSNLCAVCELDCLEYKIQGAHCIVTNTNKCRCPNIVIPEYHKELDGTGGYQSTQYQVIEIASNAFRFFSNDNVFTRSVTIPSSVTTIGATAFLYCRSLTEFKISGESAALKTIGDLAFSGCPMLKEFDAPTSLTHIGMKAFENCTSLTKFEVGDEDKIEVIGESAFFNTGITNNPENWSYNDEKGNSHTDALYIGKHLISARQVGDNTTFEVLDGTLSIAESAFENFAGLTVLVLPTSVKVIDQNAFKNCEHIEFVDFKGTAAQWFEINFLNDYASPLYHGDAGLNIEGATGAIDLSDKTFTKIPAGTFRNTTITSIILPESLVEIGAEAFENCGQLKSITFNGKNVKKVGVNAFVGSGVYTEDEDGVVYIDYILVKAKTDLASSYTIKDGTLTVADEAFKGCAGLTEITICDDLVFVGTDVFEDCNSIHTVHFEDSSYRWLLYIKDKIGRSYSCSEIDANMLRQFNGFWSRLAKSTPAA